MEKILKILIGVVSIAILIVLYYIFSNKMPQGSIVGTNQIPQQGVKSSPTPSPTSNTSKNVNSIDITALLALNPGAGATTEQMREFSAKVSGYSKDATSINVTSCEPDPQIARIKKGQPINFKNSDSSSHKIVNGKLVIDVPANSNKAIIPAFPGLGIYGYTCDTKMAGIFLVVP